MEKTDIQKLIQVEAEKIFEKKMRSVQYGNFATPRHVHNGKDAPRINQSDIVPSAAGGGRITFATSGRRYEIRLTFNPTQVLFNGVASNDTDVAMIVGCARITNDGFYLQPASPKSVQPGPAYPVVQNSTCVWGGTFASAPTSEGHIARAQRSGTIYASLTIPGGGFAENGLSIEPGDKSYKNGVLYLDCYLASGYYIIGNLMIS